MGRSNTRFANIRGKAPQIIAAAVIIALAVYVIFELLQDVNAVISFAKDATSTVMSWGYAGIFGLMLLESSSLPVPSEVILPFSGFLVSTGQLDFALAVTVATVAAIIGSLIDYYIGYKGMQTLINHRILGRVFLSVDQLTVAGKWFGKYGSLVVFIARLIPGLRTIISFPAGAAKMPLAKFIAYTTAGCVLWNAILVYVGYYLGSNWRAVASFSEYIIVGVVITLVVLVLAFLFVRRRRKQALNSTLSPSA